MVTVTAGKRKSKDGNPKPSEKKSKKLTKADKLAALERARQWAETEKATSPPAETSHLAAVTSTGNGHDNDNGNTGKSTAPTPSKIIQATTASSTTKMSKKMQREQAVMRAAEWAAEERRRSTTKTKKVSVQATPPSSFSSPPPTTIQTSALPSVEKSTTPDIKADAPKGGDKNKRQGGHQQGDEQNVISEGATTATNAQTEVQSPAPSKKSASKIFIFFLLLVVAGGALYYNSSSPTNSKTLNEGGENKLQSVAEENANDDPLTKIQSGADSDAYCVDGACENIEPEVAEPVDPDLTEETIDEGEDDGGDQHDDDEEETIPNDETELQVEENPGKDLPTFTPEDIRVAAYRGETEKVAEYIQAEPTWIDVVDANMWAAIHEAVRMNQQDTVRVLVEAGCNLNIRTNADESPLDLANAMHGEDHPMTQYLRSVGAE